MLRAPRAIEREEKREPVKETNDSLHRDSDNTITLSVSTPSHHLKTMEFVSETNQEQNAKVTPQVETESPTKSPLAATDPTHTYLVERVKGGFFKPTIYSIKPLLNEDSHAAGVEPVDSNQRLWARMHFGQKTQYCLSGDIEDLNKPRKKRGNKFVGKIQVDYPQRVYRGWTQTAKDDTRSHLVTIVYDHERKASVDIKMEVGLPLEQTTNFHEDFMTVYRDGTQNLAKADKILVLFQGDDSANMATEESLKGLKGTAAVVSTKNFSLVKGKAVRANMYAENVDSEEHGKAPESPVGDAEDAFMHFGKISQDKFSCRFRSPIDIATAFMIILSRFDTTQKYE